MRAETSTPSQTDKTPNDTQAVVTTKKHTMAPPAATVVNKPKPPTGELIVQLTPLSTPTTIISHRKNDGNETDSSHTSQASYSSRRTRSRRSPPGKKMRPNENASSSAEQTHEANDVQQ
nr:uncharacterized protein LOC115258915 [Aedes albopictus]